MTYQPKTVYHQQGSTKLVCSSGAEIAIEEGGYLVIESGGKMVDETVTMSTAASTAMANNGLSVIKTTAAAVYILERPELGIYKEIASLSTFLQKVKTVAGTRLTDSTLGRVIDFVANTTQSKAHGGGGRCVQLRGRSSAIWAVVGIGSTAVVTMSSAT